jgi:hypothetical protein
MTVTAADISLPVSRSQRREKTVFSSADEICRKKNLNFHVRKDVVQKTEHLIGITAEIK